MDLGSVPGPRFGESNDHTFEVVVEEDLASEPGVLVEGSGSGIADEDVLLVVGARGELVEPLLGNVDLAVGRAGVDLLEAVGLRVDQARVDQGLQQGLAGQAHHLVLLSHEVDRREPYDAVGDLLRGRGGAAVDQGFGEEREGGEAVRLRGQSLQIRDCHWCFLFWEARREWSFGWEIGTKEMIGFGREMGGIQGSKFLGAPIPISRASSILK